MGATVALPFAKRFKDLLVYQRAFDVSIDVHGASLSFPKHEQYAGIADQMRRASKSVCANIAEGHGKSAYAGEWKRFLLMALGSCEEMQVWCDYALKLGYIQAEMHAFWTGEYRECALMVQGILSKLKEKAA